MDDMRAVVYDEADGDDEVDAGDHVDGEAPEVHEAPNVNLRYILLFRMFYRVSHLF